MKKNVQDTYYKNLKEKEVGKIIRIFCKISFLKNEENSRAITRDC